MEILHTQSRYNGSSFSAYSYDSKMEKKVGLLIFYDKASKEAQIVFKTRNLTKSIAKTNKTSSNIDASDDESKFGHCPSRASIIKPCLLSSHGLSNNGGSSSSLNKLDRLDHNLNLLPMTACIKHGTTSFLPLDCVQKLPEYTRTTHSYPVFKVIHRFEDCVLEFPHPPPIGSSEAHLFRHDYASNCYQCFAKLSLRRTVYMYRDYLFCCPGCRLKACAAHYWYKKAIKAVDDEKKDRDGLVSSTMEGDTIFTIDE